MTKYTLIILIGLILTLGLWAKIFKDVHAAAPVVTAGCTAKQHGDANCDGLVDTADLDIWKREYYIPDKMMRLQSFNADFTGDMKVDLIDFEIWRQSAIK